VGKSYYDTVISYMNKNGFHYSGWAWWIDEKPNPAFPSLIKDWVKGTPWNGGALIFKDIYKNSGTPIDGS
jgi:hypothetical protein